MLPDAATEPGMVPLQHVTWPQVDGHTPTRTLSLDRPQTMSSSEDGDSSSSYDEYESLPTWQQYLKAHPIFSSKAAAAGGHPGPDKLPPSPSLQPIGRDVSGLSMSTGSTYAQSALASAASTPQPAQGGSTAASGLAHQGVMAVVRDAELLLAVGSQLRIASIPEVKSNVEAHAADENSSTFSAFSQSGKVGQYKVGCCKLEIFERSSGTDFTLLFRSLTCLKSHGPSSPSSLLQPTLSSSPLLVSLKLSSSSCPGVKIGPLLLPPPLRAAAAATHPIHNNSV